MPEPTDKAKYARAKAKYKDMKHSAYKSGLVVKAYKKWVVHRKVKKILEKD